MLLLQYTGYLGLCIILSSKATGHYKSHGASPFPPTPSWNCKLLLLLFWSFWHYVDKMFWYADPLCFRMPLWPLPVILVIIKKILSSWTNHQWTVDSFGLCFSVHIGVFASHMNYTFTLFYFCASNFLIWCKTFTEMKRRRWEHSSKKILVGQTELTPWWEYLCVWKAFLCESDGSKFWLSDRTMNSHEIMRVS